MIIRVYGSDLDTGLRILYQEDFDGPSEDVRFGSTTLGRIVAAFQQIGEVYTISVEVPMTTIGLTYRVKPEDDCEIIAEKIEKILDKYQS